MFSIKIFENCIIYVIPIVLWLMNRPRRRLGRVPKQTR